MNPYFISSRTSNCDNIKRRHLTISWKYQLMLTLMQQHICKQLDQADVLHCGASPLLLTSVCKHLEVRRAADVVSEERCLILVWCRIPAAQQSWTFTAGCLVLCCSRCFSWSKVWTAVRPVQQLDLLLKSCCCDDPVHHGPAGTSKVFSDRDDVWMEQMLIWNLHVLFSSDGVFPDVPAVHHRL